MSTLMEIEEAAAQLPSPDFVQLLEDLHDLATARVALTCSNCALAATALSALALSRARRFATSSGSFARSAAARARFAAAVRFFCSSRACLRPAASVGRGRLGSASRARSWYSGLVLARHTRL